MAEPAPLTSDEQDSSVPFFQIKIDGKILPKDIAADVVQITYTDSLGSIDSVEITVNNKLEDRSRASEFKYSDDKIFNPGKELELQLGYLDSNHQRVMLRGEIVALKPSFPASGQSTVSVTALNLLHKLRQEPQSQVYEKQTDSQVAKRIGSRLGITVAAKGGSSEPKHEYLIQDNQYDILFLLDRARRIGYDLFIEQQAWKDQLYFGPTGDVRNSVYELRYGRELTEFEPSLCIADQVSQVTVRGWDAVNKKKIEQVAKRIASAESYDAENEFSRTFTNRKEVIASMPISSDAEARAFAKGAMDQNTKELITGKGSIVGLPDLRAGKVIDLTGLGKRFSGRYFVTATTHEFGSDGYRTFFECRREE